MLIRVRDVIVFMTVEVKGDGMHCPVCESGRVANVETTPSALAYRCADCDAAFNESISRVSFPDRDS